MHLVTTPVRFLTISASIWRHRFAKHWCWQAAFLSVAGMLSPLHAHAHVKWLSKMATCPSTPLTPLEILGSPTFLWLAAIALATILAAAFIDDRLVSNRTFVSHLTTQVDQKMACFVSPILRIGMAIYFVTMPLYFRKSPILLTPELHTTAPLIPELQLTIAVLLMFRRTVLLAALGIAPLFADSVASFGVFHMLDFDILPALKDGDSYGAAR